MSLYVVVVFLTKERGGGGGGEEEKKCGEKNEDHEEEDGDKKEKKKERKLNELVTAKSKQLNKQKCTKGEVPAVGIACKAIFWQNPGLKGADSFTSLGSR